MVNGSVIHMTLRASQRLMRPLLCPLNEERKLRSIAGGMIVSNQMHAVLAVAVAVIRLVDS